MIDFQNFADQGRDLVNKKLKSEVGARSIALKKLLTVLKINEEAVIKALKADFSKPEFETIATETEVVISELRLMIRNLNRWSRAELISPSLLNFPSTDYLIKEPYGSVLIIAPWNYPFQLALSPLIGAVAAGNAVVLKPSELAPNTASLLQRILSEVFPPEWVRVIEGGVEVSTELLKVKWDYIFFTGSTEVGRIVARAAADHLTPITLELGGKNPCIIDDSAHIALAARRIVWGKFVNAGQTCIAPDYLLIHRSIESHFVQAFSKVLLQTYGNEISTNTDFARIISHKHYERLAAMLADVEILVGGHTNTEQRYISPTLIKVKNCKTKAMEGEIFGPILPLLVYDTIEEVDQIINLYGKPLAFYIFTTRIAQAKRMMRKFSFGGGVINDTMIHFVNHRLPFGGVGASGLGSYHGKRSFDTFCHPKPVVIKGNWLDIPLRYAPYKGKINTLKRMFRWF